MKAALRGLGSRFILGEGEPTAEMGAGAGGRGGEAVGSMETSLRVHSNANS